MTRYSRQREAILKDLMSRKDHPTAEMVYESVRKWQPNLSLGTVYRNLALLEEEGRVLKLQTGDGSVHYDGNNMPHVHFVCASCHRVTDLDYEPSVRIEDEASSSFQGKVMGYSLLFHGVCGECLRK